MAAAACAFRQLALWPGSRDPGKLCNHRCLPRNRPEHILLAQKYYVLRFPFLGRADILNDMKPTHQNAA